MEFDKFADLEGPTADPDKEYVEVVAGNAEACIVFSKERYGTPESFEQEYVVHAERSLNKQSWRNVMRNVGRDPKIYADSEVVFRENYGDGPKTECFGVFAFYDPAKVLDFYSVKLTRDSEDKQSSGDISIYGNKFQEGFHVIELTDSSLRRDLVLNHFKGLFSEEFLNQAFDGAKEKLESHQFEVFQNL